MIEWGPERWVPGSRTGRPRYGGAGRARRRHGALSFDHYLKQSPPLATLPATAPRPRGPAASPPVTDHSPNAFRRLRAGRRRRPPSRRGIDELGDIATRHRLHCAAPGPSVRSPLGHRPPRRGAPRPTPRRDSTPGGSRPADGRRAILPSAHVRGVHGGARNILQIEPTLYYGPGRVGRPQYPFGSAVEGVRRFSALRRHPDVGAPVVPDGADAGRSQTASTPKHGEDTTSRNAVWYQDIPPIRSGDFMIDKLS